MNIIRRERRGSFKAHAADGTEHTIHVLVDIIGDSTRGHPHLEADGPTHLQTDRGEHVNSTEKGRYTILGQMADIEVTSADPNAF